MIKHWLNAHQHAAALVLKKLRAAPVSNLLIAAVIGATLSLPAALYVLVDNLRQVAGNASTEPQITLFVALGASEAASKALDQRLSGHHGIKDFKFISRETAWQDLQKNNALQDVGSGLEKNPLPDAFVIHPANPEPGSVEVLQQELAQWPNVEHTQLDATWVKRLYALLQLGNKAVLVLSCLLGFALMAIVGNTIRLQIMTQREEIEVSRLIGATDRFIRRPFLHAGALHGLAGGITAWLILSFTIYVFNFSVRDLAFLYASDFALHMLDTKASLLLLLGAVALGWLGALLAVNRYLASLKN